MKFRGTGYRAHDPRWSFKPTSGEGAAIHGGRFNPKVMPALYLALDPMTAIKEANQGFAHKIEPCVMCAYEVDCEDIVDLRTEEGRIAAETSEEVLAAGWYSCLALGKSPPQWGLVAYLRSQGAAGALAPSYASGASATDSNLVLWKWGPECPHKVLVFDPSGKRPKNQLSWR